jgi:hypothetical protein
MHEQAVEALHTLNLLHKKPGHKSEPGPLRLLASYFNKSFYKKI